MGKRALDPTGRRLRNFVLLVVFAVAVPSLLLTGFGLIAIGSEREIARKRLSETYKPVIAKVVEQFREFLANLVERGDEILDELEALGQRKMPRPGAALSGFVRDERLAANFFVVAPDGEVLLPRPEAPPPSWRGYLPEEYNQGEKLEFLGGDFAGAAEKYQEALSALGPRDPRRCPALNALGRTQAKEGRAAEAIAAFETVAGECGQFIDGSGYNLAIGAHLQLLGLLARNHPDRLEPAVDWFSTWLADPALPASGAQAIFAGQRALQILPGRESIARMPALGRLRALARRAQLLSAVPGLAGSVGGKAELLSIRVEGVRRLFLIRKTDLISGFELIPPAHNPLVDGILAEMGLGELVASMHLAEEPCFEELGLATVASSAFLKATDLAWRLDLVLTDSQALQNLTRSRTTLYIWMLSILVLALLAGIGKTVQVMMRETRLSKLKTDFVSSVSHELRTPLTSIRMFTETLLLGRVRSKEEERECLETIGQETERLSRLVERILDFSRMEVGRKAYRFRPENISELIGAAVAACKPMIAEGGFAVHLHVPDDLPQPSVDRDAMVEVLINLLSNAIKYSPEGRRVDIRAAADNGHVELAVADSGMGIPRAEHQRIFEKFYRIDDALSARVSGSGLGLSLVSYIVSAHGGEIRVESAPGRGSTFTVRLPIRPESAGEKST